MILLPSVKPVDRLTIPCYPSSIDPPTDTPEMYEWWSVGKKILATTGRFRYDKTVGDLEVVQPTADVDGRYYCTAVFVDETRWTFQHNIVSRYMRRYNISYIIMCYIYIYVYIYIQMCVCVR